MISGPGTAQLGCRGDQVTDQQDKTRMVRASEPEATVIQSKRDAAGETVLQPRRVAAGETVLQPRPEVAGDKPDDATRPLPADIDAPALTLPEPRQGGDVAAEPTDDRTRALPPVSPDTDAAQTVAVPRPPEATSGTAQTSTTGTLADLIHVAERATPIHIGTVLRDRFVLDEEIGGGAMGRVFRARDLRKEEAGNRDPFVALKVLTPEYARDTRMMVGLLEEAKKAQSLAHPNVITVYDADREGAVVFLTMELLQGETLKEVIARHRDGLPREQAHDIIRGMSLGLAYAHRKGIVHSDFKPGNVFYTRACETRVLDFGIARALPRGGDGDPTAQPDAAERLSGFTPTYASPQMLAGADPEPNDDVFGLGIVAYQLLTGVHPFGNRPADQAEAMGRTPERAKHFTRNEWRALSAALAFDPALRPTDASAFLKLLEGTSALRKWAIAAMIGFGITAGYLVYDSTQQVLETLPDVAFEDLPAEQQASFNQLLGDGRLADQFNDYGSALDLYVRAYKVHPRNTEVVDAIDDLADRISAQALATGNARDRTSARENLQQVANVDEYLGSRPAITEALHALE